MNANPKERPKLCPLCGVGEKELGHKGPHTLFKDNPNYEKWLNDDGTFKRRKKLSEKEVAANRKPRQWQRYCQHQAQAGHCNACATSKKITGSSSRKMPKTPSLLSKNKQRPTREVVIQDFLQRSEEHTSMDRPLKRFRSSNCGVERGAPRPIDYLQKKSQVKNLITCINSKLVQIGLPKLTAVEKRHVKGELYPDSPGGMSSKPTNFQVILCNQDIVSERPDEIEGKLVPQRTPVGSKHIDDLARSLGFTHLAYLLNEHVRSGCTPESRKNITDFIKHHDSFDFDYFSWGDYSLAHFFRTFEFFLASQLLLETNEVVEEKWEPMSTKVGDLTKLLTEENINTPVDFIIALKQQVPDLPQFQSQLGFQLFLCQTNYDKFKRVDLGKLERVDFTETYLDLGVDMNAVIMEPKTMMKEYESKNGNLPQIASAAKSNTIVAIVAALIKSNYYAKMNLHNAADVKGFIDAAKIVKTNGHKNITFMKMLLIIHQLWVPSRMKSFAEGVGKSKRQRKRGKGKKKG